LRAITHKEAVVVYGRPGPCPTAENDRSADVPNEAPAAIETDVLVVGAGPAGLTASYLLTKAGVATTVIEADPVYVGGISRTASYRGFLFDIGGHRFFSKSREVVDLWHELLPDDIIERRRMSRIYYGGKFYSYPLKAFEALTNLGIVESGLCVLSYGWRRVFPYQNPSNLHQWVANNFGERLFRIFFKTYTEKVWGMACDHISADWAAQRIKGLDLVSAVMNALKKAIAPKRPKSADGKVIKTLIDSFEYPRRGPGMMWEAAATKTRAAGGIIEMDCRLSRLAFDAGTGRWTIEGKGGDGAVKRWSARHVISSAPVTELMATIDPPPASLAAATGLGYRDFLTVALVIDHPDLFPDNWIYIHEPDVTVGRIQNFRSWSPEMVPDEKLACIGLEYFCFEGDDLWTMPDADLIALAKRELGQIGLVGADHVLDGTVVRQKKAYPVYDAEYAERMAAIRADLSANCPGLHLVGRNGMHKYNNQDHSMMTAMLTARNIIAGKDLYDVWHVNEDAEYHEAGTRGEEA